MAATEGRRDATRGESRDRHAKRRLLDALGGDPVDVDTLVTRTGMTSDIVMAALTGLELSGQRRRDCRADCGSVCTRT